MQLQERNSADVRQILQLAYEIAGKANQTPGLTGVFTTFSASSPQFFLEIDRDKARMLNVPIPNIFETLSINLGTAYVNDFNAFGRVYQVRAQADQHFRLERDDILKLKVRSATGALVPLGTLVEIHDVTGPALVQRYNMYVSVPLQGNAAPGVSTGAGARADGGARRRDRCRRAPPSNGPNSPCRNADRQHGDLHLRPVGAVRLPGARRAIRKLDPALRHRADRAARRARRADRRQPARPRQQHPGPDRPHRADRPRGQERHPDRRIRAAGAGARRCRRSRRRSRPAGCACGRS